MRRVGQLRGFFMASEQTVLLCRMRYLRHFVLFAASITRRWLLVATGR
ncbi:hypothetical protein N9980_00095 [bacterium]|nr:hypothetical protein [bacterium]